MVTIIYNKYGKGPAECYGLSTDAKPSEIYNASVFYEMDTGKIYLYDESSKKWLEQ